MKYEIKTHKDDKGRYTAAVKHDGETHAFYGNSLRSVMLLVTDFMVEKERQDGR